MAFGTFADLRPAQLELARRQAADSGLLNSTIAGIQSGNQLINLPQTMQDQRDMQVLKQLEKQLAVQTAQQKLYDLQNPDEAIARQIGKELQIKAALNPDLGIVQAPQGLTGVTIQTPGALTQGQMTQLAADDALGVPMVLPTAQAGLDITPIMDTGLNLDRNIANAAEAAKAANDIAKIKARYEAAGVPVRIETDENGFRNIVPTRQFGGVTPTATPVLTQDGTQLKGQIKAVKSPFTSKQVVSITDPKDIRFAIPDEDGKPPEGFRFSDKSTVSTEPIAVYNPQNPDELLGYNINGKFQNIKDFQTASKELSNKLGEERSQRNLDSIADLKKNVSPFTTGLGSLLSYIPGTSAADFEANVDTLKANIAFGELQNMRNASKTGGALGSIAVRELELLQSALGALSARQSPQSFLDNLNKIEKSINNFKQAEGSNSSKSVKIPLINSKSEYDALESGSKYTESDGKTYTKP